MNKKPSRYTELWIASLVVPEQGVAALGRGRDVVAHLPHPRLRVGTAMQLSWSTNRPDSPTMRPLASRRRGISASRLFPWPRTSQQRVPARCRATPWPSWSTCRTWPPDFRGRGRPFQQLPVAGRSACVLAAQATNRGTWYREPKDVQGAAGFTHESRRV